jgi:hypothetical protein
MNRARAVLTSAVACVALCGALAVPALAAAPQGKLTSQEYALLSSAQAKVGAALSKNAVKWSAVRAICQGPGSSTTLLKTQVAGCVAEVELFEGLADFPADESKCGNTEPHKDVCLAPLYTAIANDAGALYASVVAARQAAVQRGFTGSCLDALGDTPKQVSEQQSLATVTQGLAHEIKLAAEVVEGKLPTSDLNVSKLDSYAKAFQRDASLVIGQSSPKLSVCPHQ